MDSLPAQVSLFSFDFFIYIFLLLLLVSIKNLMLCFSLLIVLVLNSLQGFCFVFSSAMDVNFCQKIYLNLMKSF